MSTHSGPDVITNGLILYLDAANINSYSGSGATWTDLSGNNNNVTLFNSPTFSNRSFTFNGTTQYARTTNTLNLSNTSAVTILHLIKPLAYNSLSIIHELSENFNTYSDSFVASYCDNSIGQDNQIISSVKGNIGYNIAVYDKTLLNDLNWHNHCCIHNTTQSSKENLIYSDGVSKLELSNPISGQANNNSNTFGNRFLFLCSRGGSQYFSNASVSIIMVYNRALSDAEISQNFNATRSRFGL